ncbi:LOW QUALITY PROTEIN: enhanced adult sensory threshold [Aphomia sociella]
MKTKQSKEESDKSLDEDIVVEPKTRARKKASDIIEEDKKSSHDEAKTSKETKKTITKPRVLGNKRPLGIRKALRSKKVAITKNKIKAVVKQAVKRGRKATIKVEPDNSQDKETVPLIPASEIKKEPIDDTTPNSRSSSPKTAGRRQRLSSDMIMMKSVLADTPSTLVLGPRTSPYSMRSERSNSPLLSEGKNLRSGKPRKPKSNLLNEVVMKEQKKRRRLLSDSKTTELSEASEDCKKLKRGRSCSRDGSEISKCSDITESDISLNEPLNDTDSKELNKKLEKSKTDLELNVENNVQISTSPEKVPSLNVDSNLAETKPDAEPSSITNKKTKGKSLNLKRSTSLDSDNNNSNRLKIENSSDIEDKLLMKTDTLFEARSSILTSMSQTFNSKEMSKNIRKARRGRKAAAATRPNPNLVVKSCTTSTITNDSTEDKQETLETLSKEIDDLINDLDQNIDRDHEMANDTSLTQNTDQMQTKTVSKFYSLSKPLGDNNSIVTPDTPTKDKDTVTSITNESTPSKTDDSENIRLHYEEDSVDKTNNGSKNEIGYKCNPVASIDKLMDRLKEFEEFDKRRQRQESESKSSDSKPMMVTSDVVLIPKSGAEIKPLKDIQSVRSPEKTIEKENVLSCFENNSAISIVKRDQVRKSIDVDLPNTVTLIKRNSVSARKESTSSNHSKEADAKSIFESLGKDVTLTEIRKSVDKSSPVIQVDVPQFATLHPNNPTQSLAGVVLDPNQVSLTPRVINESKINNSNDVQIIPKRKTSLDVTLSRKSSESANEPNDEVMATLEKIKSPPHQIKSLEIMNTPTPVAAKSEETPPIETEALPPIETVRDMPDERSLTAELVTENTNVNDTALIKTSGEDQMKTNDCMEKKEEKTETPAKPENLIDVVDEKMTDIDKAEKDETENKVVEAPTEAKMDVDSKSSEISDVEKCIKSPGRTNKSIRNSIECQPGPSNVLHETPESQKRKENVLRTLGLLTHKAAKEAKIEKLREKERIYRSNFGGMMSSKGKTTKSGSGDYTGTLKTVIKLNRNTGDRDKKKYRSSLKMTFQKSKNRSGKTASEGAEAADDDGAYYVTIGNREAGVGATSDGGHRKSHYSNRLNNHDTETAPEPVEAKETLNLVIPEKASSFSIHPGRLCQDQCFYCGGKFGLFDTPCHIAQMKSSERQKKVLDNEEKLTIDSCLCDACFRHVDRRANCPSYRKRPMVKQPTDLLMLQSPPSNAPNETLPSPSLEEESEEDPPAPTLASGRAAICHTEGCTATADNFIRRKWLIKMRSSVNKVLKLECDYPGLHTIPLCGAHHRALAPLQACALCRRRITKHHNVHFIHHGYMELNPSLKEAGIPVQFTERPLLCKSCRTYCTLLQRAGHDDRQAKGYRRKLLNIYNIEVPPASDNEFDESSMHDDSNSSIIKQKKKQRTKSKRKSTEPEKTGDSESSERTSPHEEGSPDKDKIKEDSNESQKLSQPIEEDIESLISSNKILVPGAVKQTNEPNANSDGSESETIFEMETPLPPLDKQTELQYLLQRQNNPAQFLQKTPNLTQKQRNILKLQTVSGIQKPGQQHRINDKNAKRIHKLGNIVTYKDKMVRKDLEMDSHEHDKSKDGITILKNITLNDECTIESIPMRKPADINTMKNKWQMSESFSQVKKNLSELSKKLGGEKETKKLTDMKYSNPVKRLETNPSISVRELFPGEEEMNLQCNIEFNNVKGVTPEGWEKCNTVIQYDSETKRLWNELQKPYGNQSSFLRHLILLEKYFRSGDLVLTHNASPQAVNYSDSVQSRLRAYDNIPNDTPKRNEPAISLLEYRKKPSMNGKSLLKSNQHADMEKDPKKFMPPPGIFPKPKPVKTTDKTKSKPLPPELIAINTPNAQGRKAIQNVLHNIQQLVKDVSASDPTEVAAAPLPVPKFDTPKIDTPKEKKQDPQTSKEKKDVSKSDTPKRQKATSKPWRPTLMPITPENMAKIAREPTQVAVDGRNLHSLVQVMSSGKRYHITLQDYNKMCIMRREKLQQLQDSESKTKRQSVEETTVVTEIQPSTVLGNGGIVVQNITEDKTQDKPKESELGQLSANAANILKNVGLKNITIAPIPPKTATVTSVTAPTLLVAGPRLVGAAEAANMSSLPSHMLMPKIPKSLTVIPQTLAAPQPGSDTPRP